MIKRYYYENCVREIMQQRHSMSKICPIDASGVPLYPPRVMPPPKPLNLPQSFIKFLRNPLLTIPESVYHEPLVVLRGPLPSSG